MLLRKFQWAASLLLLWWRLLLVWLLRNSDLAQMFDVVLNLASIYLFLGHFFWLKLLRCRLWGAFPLTNKFLGLSLGVKPAGNLLIRGGDWGLMSWLFTITVRCWGELRIWVLLLQLFGLLGVVRDWSLLQHDLLSVVECIPTGMDSWWFFLLVQDCVQFILR